MQICRHDISIWNVSGNDTDKSQDTSFEVHSIEIFIPLTKELNSFNMLSYIKIFLHFYKRNILHLYCSYRILSPFSGSTRNSQLCNERSKSNLPKLKRKSLHLWCRFTRDHHLKTHMRLHTGEKPYHCSHCDRQFVQVANLRRHLRVHTGERPYACELCSAKFSDSNQLKAHLLIHKGEKPFECEQCQMRFRRRHHLIHHKCGTSMNSGQVTRTQVASPSLASDDLEEDIDIDIDVEVEEAEASSLASKKTSASVRPVHKFSNQLANPIIGNSMPIPLNLAGIPVDLPEQTEPEDLSMSTGMHSQCRPHSQSNSISDSPLSHSPSSDIIHGEDDDDIDMVSGTSSPNAVFLQSHHNKYTHFASLGNTAAANVGHAS